MGERQSQPTIVVELERWEFIVVHGFKNYNVVPQVRFHSKYKVLSQARHD